jgi:hypothetical protein
MVAGRARAPHPELLPDEIAQMVALAGANERSGRESDARSAWAAFNVYARSRYLRRHGDMMNLALWMTGIVGVVAVSIFAGIRRMHAKSSSIGTSSLVDETVSTSSTE